MKIVTLSLFLVLLTARNSYSVQVSHCKLLYQRIVFDIEENLNSLTGVSIGESINDLSERFFSLKRINEKKDVAWIGPDVPRRLKITVSSFSDRLSVSSLTNLQNSKMERTADSALQEVGAFLGSEQGHRLIWMSGITAKTPELLKLLDKAIEENDGATKKKVLSQLKEIYSQSANDLAAHVRRSISDNSYKSLMSDKKETVWPTDGRLLSEEMLVASLKNAHSQLYDITVKKDMDPSYYYLSVLHSGMIASSRDVAREMSSFKPFIEILEALPSSSKDTAKNISVSLGNMYKFTVN